MTFSSTTSAGRRTHGLGVLVLLLGGVPVFGQTLEDRYQRAIDFFNTAKAEDACELFTQIEKEKPDYKQTRTYLNPACKSAELSYAMEEKLFNEGLQFFNQGQYDDAKQRFEQARGVPLKNPKYRDQIPRYLKEIEARLNEERLFQDAVKLFNEGNDTAARSRFHQVVQLAGGKAAEARSYLQRIEERREESGFNEGVRLFSSGDYAAARTRFQEVIGLGGKKKVDAERYLGQIDAAEREQRAFNDAVHAFEQKRYSEAKAAFQQVAAMNGRHKAEAEQSLKQIDSILKEEAIFRDAERKYQQKDLEGAKAGFNEVVRLGGPYASQARAYLARMAAPPGEDPKKLAARFIGEARELFSQKRYAEAADKLRTALTLDTSSVEANRLLTQTEDLATQQPLRQGLEAFFAGRYEEAEQQLTNYLEGKSPKRSLALFFRAAVYSTRYFLSGESDPKQRQKALADFGASKPFGNRLRTPEKFVSPKILALYSEAVEGSSR
jgi:tetratricopeptide (TPR) repeat protein